MSRDFFKSIRADQLGLDLGNAPDNISDDPYGQRRRCERCQGWLNYKNKKDLCGPCSLALTRPPSSKAKSNNKINKKRKAYREDEQTATARVEICQRYNVSSEEVLDFAKRPRDNRLAFARCLLVYFLVEYLEKSTAEVTRAMRMGSRSTAESSYRRGKTIIEIDLRARQIIAEVGEIVFRTA